MFIIYFKEGVHIVLEYVGKHPELQVEDIEFDKWCDKVVETLEKTKKEFLISFSCLFLIVNYYTFILFHTKRCKNGPKSTTKRCVNDPKSTTKRCII